MKARKNSDSGHSFEDYFKRTVNPMIILSFLQDRPKYAYEMALEMKERSGGAYTMPLLYPVLYRLQNQGYVEVVEQMVSQSNRMRIYYQITPAGRAYLREIKAEYLRLCGLVKRMVDFSAAGECPGREKEVDKKGK